MYRFLLRTAQLDVQFTMYNVAAEPVIIHPVLMSILFEHYKQLSRMGGKVRIGRLTPLQQDQWSDISLNQCFPNLPKLFF